MPKSIWPPPTLRTTGKPPNLFLLMNSKIGRFCGADRFGVVRKKRIVILVETQLTKEDNDAFESRSDSRFWMGG